MRNHWIISAAAILLLAGPAVAQTAAPVTPKDAMARLAWMDGVWKGTTTYTMQDGMTVVSRQAERMGPMMDGTVRVIDGLTYDDKGAVTSQAVGMISYDQRRGAYEFRAYQGGNAVTAPAIVVENGYSWTFENRGMPQRATITLKDGVYHEVIEIQPPGRPWFKVADVVLRRTGSSDWPAAGAPRP